MLWKDGSSFKGEWKGGLPNGFGTHDITQEHLKVQDRKRKRATMKTMS